MRDGGIPLKRKTAGKELAHRDRLKENRNREAMARQGRSEKLEVPSLLMLSLELTALRVRSSDLFETADPEHPGNDPAKVITFLKKWAAVGSRIAPPRRSPDLRPRRRSTFTQSSHPAGRNGAGPAATGVPGPRRPRSGS